MALSRELNTNLKNSWSLSPQIVCGAMIHELSLIELHRVSPRSRTTPDLHRPRLIPHSGTEGHVIETDIEWCPC